VAAGLAPHTPAAVIAAASTAQEHILVSTLGLVAAQALAHGIEAPAIVVIGDIVDAREGLLANTAAQEPLR
jgi:uroporphyrin-III C-methyltransferase